MPWAAQRERVGMMICGGVCKSTSLAATAELETSVPGEDDHLLAAAGRMLVASPAGTTGYTVRGSRGWTELVEG